MEGIDWTTLYWLLSLTAAMISTAIAVYLAPHWGADTPRRLLSLMIAVAIWSLTYAMEYKSSTLALKLWWVKAEYFGSVWIGVLFFMFILSITGKERWLSRKNQLLLCIVPVFAILLALTNQSHHLMWRLAWLDFSGPTPMVVYLRGAGFWMLVGYSYTLLLVGTVILLHAFVSAKHISRKQLTVVLVGLSVPVACNLLYLFNSQLLRNLDVTPMAFTISGIVYAWGLFRYQLLNIIPLAHEAVIDGMSDSVLVLDRHDQIVDINKAAETVFGDRATVLSGKPLTYFRSDLARFVAMHRCAKAQRFEIELPVRSETRQWSMHLSPLLSRKGRHNGWLIILRDITDRQKAEGALRESEEMHRAMLEAAPNPIVVYNLNGEVTYINPAFTSVYGWPLAELVGKRLDFVPPEHLAETVAAVKKTYANPDGNYDFITRRLTRDGRLIDVSINSTIYHDKQGQPAGMVVNFTDITHIKKTETELRNTKNYIRNIIDSMPSVLIGVDTKIRVTQWNLEAENLTGIKAAGVRGQYLPTVFPPLAGQTAAITGTITSGTVHTEPRVPLSTGTKALFADITIYPIGADRVQGVVIRVDDITERLRLEEVMVQSEKMLSIGGLAAGMAHEINNPLAGIMQTTQVIKNRVGADLQGNAKVAAACGLELDSLAAYLEKRGVAAMLDQILSSGRRAAKIVDNILSFSRKSDQAVVSTHDLSRLLDTTVEIMGNDYDLKKRYDFRSIEIIREYGQNVPPVLCEKSKIQQVFFNILKNGAEAMANWCAGPLEFTLRHYQADGMVVVEIEDNGPGMDADTRKRVFEPFFTSKQAGVGTGLGLSVSYFIITSQHAGSLDVDASPESGAKFILKLPVIDA